jgi:hypothetical protein
MAAIRVLQRLRTSGVATEDDQAVLVRYVGWGGLAQAFDARNEDWHAEHLELASCLSREEYAQARRSTQDAH